MSPANLVNHKEAAQHVENASIAKAVVEEIIDMSVEIHDLEEMLASLPEPVHALSLSLDPYRSGLEVTNLGINLKNEAQDAFKHEGAFASEQACQEHITKIEEFAVNKWQFLEDKKNDLHMCAASSINAMQFALETVQFMAQLHLMQAVIPFEDEQAVEDLCQNFIEIINAL